jgi:lipid-A-disaccharide synthase
LSGEASPVRLLVSCGEASGDLYAAELVRHLRAHVPTLSVFGVGGDRLRAQGAGLVAHVRDMAVIGLVEVLRHLRRLRRVFDRVLAEVDHDPPRLAVLVDYAGFNLRLARELRRRGVPIVYYVSPQVWAWRRGRIRTIRETVARMLVLFPFEEPLYREARVPVTFVGHPLVDLARRSVERPAFLQEVGLAASRPVVALLPGSREQEIEHNLPPLAGAVRLLAQRRPDLQFVLAAAPSLDAARLTARLAGLPVRVVSNRTYDVLASAGLALVASGTATIETALLETPMVVVYRVSPVSYAVGRPFVRVPHYAMVNLVAGRRIVPELIQGEFTPQKVAREALSLLQDAEKADTMRREFREVRRLLGEPGASGRAAWAVFETLKSSTLDGTRASGAS